MHPQRKAMAVINVVGGLSVIGSYIHGISTHEDANVLWGGVPESIWPVYSSWMFVAAAGYLTLAFLLFFKTDPEKARVAGRFGFGIFNVLLVGILLPSAVWMPLTFAYVENPTPGLWLAVRAGLATTGICSLGLIAALVALRPREPAKLYWASVAGSVGFFVQTGILDAVVWTAMFHR